MAFFSPTIFRINERKRRTYLISYKKRKTVFYVAITINKFPRESKAKIIIVRLTYASEGGTECMKRVTMSLTIVLFFFLSTMNVP